MIQFDKNWQLLLPK